MAELPLNSLEIAEYRGLSGLQLQEFGAMNLFVGSNNSAKTSVLEALALFARPLDIETWLDAAWGRDSQGSPLPLGEAVKWLFPRTGGTHEDTGRIWMTGKGSFAGRKLVAQYVEEHVAGGVMKEGGVAAGSDDHIRRTVELSLAADFVKRLPHRDEWRDYQNTRSVRIVEAEELTYPGTTPEPSLPVDFVRAWSHCSETEVRGRYSLALQKEAPQQDVKADLIRVLQQVDSGVQRLDLVQTGRMAPQLQVKHALTGVTPLSAFGDGFRRALLIAVAVPTVRGGLLLIDELEAALHVSVRESVLKLLQYAVKNFDVQVFATTHSLEAVDSVLSVFQDSLPAVAGFRLEREDGRAVAKRLPGELLHELRYDMGLEFR